MTRTPPRRRTSEDPSLEQKHDTTLKAHALQNLGKRNDDRADTFEEKVLNGVLRCAEMCDDVCRGIVRWSSCSLQTNGTARARWTQCLSTRRETDSV